MNKLKDKKTLIFIVVFLVLLSPVFVYSTFIKTKYFLNENPNQEKQKNGFLYFYSDNLYLGKYKCTSDVCDYSKSLKDEKLTNFFASGEKQHLDIINNKYVFLTDDGKEILYDIEGSKTITEFNHIKFYNTDIEGDIVLLSYQNRWGAMSLKNLSIAIGYNYDYLGILKTEESNYLKTDKFIAGNGGSYYLINRSEEVLTEYFPEMIYYYTDKYVVLKKDRVKIYKYDGEEILYSLDIKEFLVEDYLFLQTNNLLLIYEDFENGTIDHISLNAEDKIKVEKKDDKVLVYINEKLEKSLPKLK